MAAVTVPFIPSTSAFFQVMFTRRPDAILAMVPAGSSVPLIYTAPSGRLMLTPLATKDSRTHALLRLRQLLSLVTFRRTVAPGDPEGEAFRIPLSQIHEEMPDDIQELVPPAIGFLPIPGPGVHDSMGMGGLDVLEETKDMYGPGTVVVRYGELIEPFTIEVVAAKKSHRRAVVAGLQQILRLVEESRTLRLTLPDLFNSIADFELTDTLYIDDPYVAQNRRKAHLHVTLTVSEVFLASGIPELQPSVTVDVGLDVELGNVSPLAQLDPSLPADVIAALEQG